MKPVTRTATCAVYGGLDVDSNLVLSGAALAERLGWLAALVAGIGQGVLDAHWCATDVAALSADVLPDGRRTPKFAYKAVATLWGWVGAPAGVYVPSRVVWMAQELAGRQLRSAAYRAAAVGEATAGGRPADAVTDAVTYRNTLRQVGRFRDEHGRLPVDLFELAPKAPRVPVQVVLAASDRQFSRVTSADNRMTVELLLPMVAAPASRAQWAWARMETTLPDRYASGAVKAPTLRVVNGQVRADVPVDLPQPPTTTTGTVFGLDWGVRRLLTGTFVQKSAGAAVTDGRPLFFDAGPLMAKAHRLRGHREHARGRAARIDVLLEGRPDVALEARRGALLVEADRCDRKQRALGREVARLAARWVVTQAQATGAGVIAVEDLRTLEHRGLGRRTNVRVSMGLRGQVRTSLDQAAALAGVRVVDVNARGSSAFCPRCDGKLTHRTAPDGPVGHAWARCPGCGWSADRDHSAAVKIAGRGLARTEKGVSALTVRTRRGRRATLTRAGRVNAPARPPRLRDKTSSTPTRSSRHLSSSHAGRASTPPLPSAGHRSVGPDTQDTPVQCRNDRTATLAFEGARWAYRRHLRATPELYARRPAQAPATAHSGKLKS